MKKLMQACCGNFTCHRVSEGDKFIASVPILPDSNLKADLSKVYSKLTSQPLHVTETSMKRASLGLCQEFQYIPSLSLIPLASGDHQDFKP